MVISRSALWGVSGSLVMIVGLQACATTPWTNAAKSQTEVTADQAACDAQLAQETQRGAVSLYVAEPFGVVECRRCMQRKGWSPPHWKPFLLLRGQRAVDASACVRCVMLSSDEQRKIWASSIL